jgi:hypothetical protein
MRRSDLGRWICRLTFGSVLACAAAGPGQAYLYWVKPDFTGAAVTGNEPGIVLPLVDAKPAEISANLVWNLRAALNVAALQCQFSPPLMTVRNYNTILSQHSAEINAAYKTLGLYFKRTSKTSWQRAFDTHTTRTYNGFSTLHAQIGFCETAGKIGRLALGARKGQLLNVATLYMSEIRNSLVPKGDGFFAFRPSVPPVTLPPLDDRCWSRKGEIKPKCLPAA